MVYYRQVIVVYTHMHADVSRNIIKHIDELQWTNEHLLYKNIPLTLYSKGFMLVLCERWVGDGDTMQHIDPKFFSRPHQHFFLILAELLNRGSLRAQALCLELVLTPRASYVQLRLELTQTDGSKPSVAPVFVIVWHPHASCGRTHLHRIQPRTQFKVIFRHPRPDAPASLFFCLFTQVHFLIDGSFADRYVTIDHIINRCLWWNKMVIISGYNRVIIN